MPRLPKVGFASTDWSRSMATPEGPVPGGSNWIRLQQSRPHLAYSSVTGLLINHDKHGLGVMDWFGKPHYDLDVLVMQRLMFGSLVENLSARRGNQVIINDVDDWYWGLHEDNHAYLLTHPDHNKDENIDHYKKVLQLSDAVTVSTPFLMDKISNKFGCRNVHLIDNHVNVPDFTIRYPRNKKPIVGWVGSTSHRSGDLEILTGVLDSPRFRVHHSGHVDGAAWFADKAGLPRDKVSKTPMHHPKMYARLSFQFDIGIAPLNDIPFNHAKSWIKAIEYAAANIPFVASDLGEYRRLRDEYGIGLLASSHDEWVDNLRRLCDYNERMRMGKAQREVVTAQLNAPAMAKKWDAVLAQYI